MRKIFTTVIFTSMMMLAMNVSAITPLPDQGVYRIKNVYSGTYVKLQSNYLADITATSYDEASPLLVWYGERDENGEALLTNLSGDGGDMIETLEFIKGLIEDVLVYNNQPTWFLEEMFQLHLVPTGDADGSVFLCVDVPEIENWETIRDIILEAAAGQTAVTYYISHMVPGNRHYMGIDYDGSFGYRLQAGTPEGTDIKFLMERESLEGGYCFVKTASATAEAPYLRRVHEKSSTVDLASPHNDASAVFDLAVSDIKVTRLAVQGLDLAPLAQAAGGYLALCPTNTAAQKFVYDAYALKLQLPDEGVDAAAVVAAAKAALGEDSEIAAALESHSDLIKNRAALYVVHSDNGGITLAGDNNFAAYGDAAKWKLELIDTQDNYFAPAATVEADGKYYTTLYAAFPFTIVNTGNVVAYDVMQILDGGKPFMEPIETTTIPALTPVLLEMTTHVDADNMLMPVLDSNAQGIGMMAETQQSMLEGTLFDDNTTYTGPTMLTLHEGLTFAADASLEFMPANKAWVNKDINTAISKIGNDDASGDDTIYDLMGRKVINPPHGIYIKNGKKVVF
jgi:hypothetical protein